MKPKKKYQQQEETPQTVQEPMATYGTQAQEDVYAPDVEEEYTEEDAKIQQLLKVINEMQAQGKPQEVIDQEVQELLAAYGMLYPEEEEEVLPPEEAEARARIKELYAQMDEMFERGETFEDLMQEAHQLYAKYGMQTAAQRQAHPMTQREIDALLEAEMEFARGEYYTQEEVDAEMEQLFEELDKEWKED
jgi:hypothetical protein